MTTQVRDDGKEVTWYFAKTKSRAEEAAMPIPWDITITGKGAAATASFANGMVMRGPITALVAVEPVGLPESGTVYVSYWFNTETGTAEIKVEESIADAVDTSVPPAGPYIKRLLYILTCSASGAWGVSLDCRSAPYAGEWT